MKDPILTPYTVVDVPLYIIYVWDRDEWMHYGSSELELYMIKEIAYLRATHPHKKYRLVKCIRKTIRSYEDMESLPPAPSDKD